MPHRHPWRPLAVAVAFAVAALLSPAAATPAAESPVALEQLAFLTGCWRATHGETVIEELWLPPAGGVMLGVSRSVDGGALDIFEFLRLEQRDGAWHYVAQPRGVPPTWFKLTSVTDHEAVFEDPAHDFPQKIRYRRDGVDELHAEISGPGRDGKEKTFPFHYRRASCPNEQAREQ
jgi:hypothetical protein